MWIEFAQAWSLFTLTAFLVVVVLLILTTENENAGGGALLLLAWLIALTLFTDFKPWNFVREHWLALLVAVPLYLVLGVAWAVFRWTLYVRDPDNYGGGIKKLDSSESQHRHKIVVWMSWWWVSMIWWCLSWPRKIFSALFASLSGVFDRISEGARRP